MPRTAALLFLAVLGLPLPAQGPPARGKAPDAKDAEALAGFYAHESSVFGSAATRSEPGRLAATRRQREYFGAHSTVKAMQLVNTLSDFNIHSETIPSNKSQLALNCD